MRDAPVAIRCRRALKLALAVVVVTQLAGGATRADPAPPRIRHLYDGPCAELDDGEIVCSVQAETEPGCRFERVRAGSVTRVGASLCALASSGAPRSLEGSGCDRDPTTNRLIPVALKTEALSCRHELDRSVSCFGANESPRRLLRDVQSIQVGNAFFCALRAKGDVWCWGKNREGGLGDGRSYEARRPVRVRLSRPAVELAVGGQHACVRFGDGQVACWGEHSHGALGIGHLPSQGDIPQPGSPPEYLTPQMLRALPRVASIAAGGGKTCALTRAGEVYCWGELGPDARPFASPQRIAGLPTAQELVFGETSCALAHGQIFCWGDWCPFNDLGVAHQPTKIDWPIIPPPPPPPPPPP